MQIEMITSILIAILYDFLIVLTNSALLGSAGVSFCITSKASREYHVKSMPSQYLKTLILTIQYPRIERPEIVPKEVFDSQSFLLNSLLNNVQ